MAIAMVLVLSAAIAHAETRFALVIGSNQAPQGGIELKYAIRDAHKLSHTLIELGRLKQNHLIVVTNPNAATLEQSLQKLSNAMQAVNDRKSLLIYYSGHANADALELGAESYSLSTLRQRITAMSADIRIAILDACHSGAFTQTKGAKRVKGYDINWEAPQSVEGAVWISSSTAEEASIESDDIGGSLFSHFFVSGLRGAADQNLDQKIDLDEAFNYAYHHTVERSAQTRSGVQHPSYRMNLSGQQQVVLSWLSQKNARLSFAGSTAGTYLVFDRKRDQVVAEVIKPKEQPVHLNLQAGDYYVKKRLKHHILLKKISLHSGELVALSDEQMRTVPFEEDVTKGKLSAAFKPTWQYGSPPILDTAYTLRRGELILGLLHPTAYGISDDVMIYSSIDEMLGYFSPNLGLRARLIRGPLTWSMNLSSAVNFSRVVQDEQKLATTAVIYENTLSHTLGTNFILSGRLSYILLSGPIAHIDRDSFYIPAIGSTTLAVGVNPRYDDSDLNKAAQFNILSTNFNLISFLSENFFIRTDISVHRPIGVSEDTYSSRWVVIPQLSGAYAWDTFRMELGMGLDVISKELVPRAALWWQYD